MIDALPAYCFLLPFFAAFLAPLLGALWPGGPRKLGLAILAGSASIALFQLSWVLQHGPLRHRFGGWVAPWGIEWIADPLSAAMALLVLVLALLNQLQGWEHEAGDPGERAGVEQGLRLLFVSGLTGLCLTSDLFNVYVFLEIAGLSSYALVAAGGRGAPLAAFRYLLLGGAGATLFVLGLGLAYGLTGTLNMGDMARLWPAVSGSAALAATALMTTGLLVKMAVFPLHGWQPEAYRWSPPGFTPLLASAPSKAAAFVLFKLLHLVFVGAGEAQALRPLLASLGALSVLAGSWLAWRQDDLRAMLAYSSVGQMGYLLIGLSLGSLAASTGLFLYIVSHALLKAALFIAVGSLARAEGQARLSKLGGLARRRPYEAWLWAACGLALAGLPPAGPFFAKWYLVSAALQAGSWTLAAAMLAGSLLTALYVFKAVEVFWFREAAGTVVQGRPPWTSWVPAGLLGGAALLSGLFHRAWAAGLLEPALLWRLGR